MSKYSDNTNSKNNFQNLINEIKSNLETHFKGLLSKMFIGAEEELFELADNAPSNEEQHRYFELMRVLREDKQDISTTFLVNTNLLLRPFAETETDKKKSADYLDDELSLVGQDEMDNMVLIKSIAGDVTGKNREAISHLEARLEHLALKTPLIFHKKALDPIKICETFNDALLDRFDTEDKKLVFQLFDNDVAAKLDTIYDAINNLLIEADVLPQIKLHAKKSTSKQRPEPSTENYSGDGVDEPGEAINQGGYAMTATPGHSSQSTRQPGYSGTTNAPPGGAGGGTRGAYSTHGTGNQTGYSGGAGAAAESGGAGGGFGGAGAAAESGGAGGGFGGAGAAAEGGGAGGGFGGAGATAESGGAGGGFGGAGATAEGGGAGGGFGGAGAAAEGGGAGGGFGGAGATAESGGAGGGFGGAGAAAEGGGAGGGFGGAGAAAEGGGAGGDFGGAGATAEGGGYAGVEGSDGDGSASHSANYQHNTAGMSASHVSDVIGEYMGTPLAPHSLEEGGASESYPAATPQYYGHDDVLTALSSIQIKPEFSSTGELKFDAEAIKQAVLAEISKTSGGVVTKRINRIAEKTIDFIELIFDAIIEDEDISDTIKALLLRLQIPVIKASMVDQEFFIYDDHPARVLLDKIAEVGIGVTEHTDEVYIQLDRIISKLVNEFELQTSSFQEALDDINDFIDEREEAARSQEEESQRQVLREHARNTVLKSLRSTTTGKVLPELIHALVLKRWPTLMYNHYLNHGKENDEWITIIEILRSIIDSVQPLKNSAELNNLLNTKDKLVDTTFKYLNRTNQSKQDIENVIQGLKDVHQQHIDDADFSEEHESPEETEEQAAVQDAQETEHTAESTTEPETSEPEIIDEEPAGPELPSNIMPGMWFQIYMGEDKAQRRGKLSVIIVQDSKLVFVNYQGGIIAEKSFEQFIEELELDQSKMIMGHSAFDHALSRVVNNLDTKH